MSRKHLPLSALVTLNLVVGGTTFAPTANAQSQSQSTSPAAGQSQAPAAAAPRAKVDAGPVKSGVQPVTPQRVAATSLTVDGFLEQVARQNEGYQRAEKSEQGYRLRSSEYHLLTSPNLFGSVQTMRDRSDTALPAQTGDDTKLNSYSLGVSQVTNFGLAGRLYYNLNDTQVNGAAQPIHFYTSGPRIELSQSLWRNFFGSEIRANQDLIQADALANQYSEEFNKLQFRNAAESAYWRLAIAREAVQALRETLDRATRSRDLSARQNKLQLSDRADYLQAEAALAARQLEFQSAIDEERAAARSFNTIRGVDALEVTDTLSPISDQMIQSLAVPKRSIVRADVRASEQQAKLLRARSQTGAETTKPDVKVFLNAGLNGRDNERGEAVSESLGGDRPNYAVGVNFTVPLQQGVASDARQGYAVLAESADLLFRRKSFETEREWTELVQQFEQTKTRLTFASKLEQAQKAKLDAERDRHRRGRSTIFQVIQFEEDYANSQLNRIRIQAAVLDINSKLKTFGGVQ